MERAPLESPLDARGSRSESMSRATPALEGIGVVRRYGSTTALDAVDLTVATGRCTALVGESGSGKTTLLRTFNRLVVPDAGTVRVRGRPVDEPPPETLRRSIGYVPQHGGLLPHWTVLANVALVPRLQKLDDADQLARVALKRVGLPDHFATRWPRALSGGERQRVALARALAADPDIVLLDEPFGALDALTRSDVQRVFAAQRAERGFSALLVTHDLREALDLADEIAVMREGRILQKAAPDALLRAPEPGYVTRLLERAGVRS